MYSVSGRVFLSTPSARRATTKSRRLQRQRPYFYPRPPRGGRPKSCSRGFWSGGISIHALREEGDESVRSFLDENINFYPRPPRGGRHGHHPAGIQPANISIHALREEGDLALLDPVLEHPISIHALREEGDLVFLHVHADGENFYPRPPRGGRPSSSSMSLESL